MITRAITLDAQQVASRRPVIDYRQIYAEPATANLSMYRQSFACQFLRHVALEGRVKVVFAVLANPLTQRDRPALGIVEEIAQHARPDCRGPAQVDVLRPQRADNHHPLPRSCHRDVQAPLTPGAVEWTKAHRDTPCLVGAIAD